MCYFILAFHSLLITLFISSNPFSPPGVTMQSKKVVTPITKNVDLLVAHGSSGCDQMQKNLESQYDIFKVEAAANLLRKSLNDSHCNGSSWLLSTIRDIIDEPVQDLEMHSFVFENSQDAAHWNAQIIKENIYN